MKTFDKKQLWFIAIFTLLGFAFLQIPLTHIIGSKASFTLFDCFAPLAGGFLGCFAGAISVILMQLFNFFVHGAKVVDAGTIIKFFPMIFAALYFSKRSILNIIIPALAMIIFITNPIGHTVWYYSLYWLIPIVCYFFQEQFLLARSLGATFTAHAVGGALWVTFLPLPKLVWLSLIPIVAIERLTFAVGITVSYLAINNLLNYINAKNIITYQLPVNTQYVWKLRHN